MIFVKCVTLIFFSFFLVFLLLFCNYYFELLNAFVGYLTLQDLIAELLGNPATKYFPGKYKKNNDKNQDQRKSNE